MKIFKALSVLLIICLALTSCTRAPGKINELTVVQALFIDSKEGKTKAEIQYLRLASSEDKKGGADKAGLVYGRGKSISRAISDASRRISDEFFFGQNKIVVFGMSYAKSSIDKGIEYLLKSKASRPDVIAAISESDTEDIIKSSANSTEIPAESIYKLLRLGEKNGQCAAVTVCDLLNLYNDETSDIYLSVLKADKKQVMCGGIAVFSNEKYAKTLNEGETLGFLLLKNRVKNAQTEINTASLGAVSLKITGARAKKSVEVKNGRIYFCADLKLKCEINETQLPIGKRLSEDEYAIIREACEEKIKALCFGTVNECFNNESDPFMTARYLCKEDAALYNSLKSSWRENLKNIDVKVEVEAEIIKL